MSEFLKKDIVIRIISVAFAIFLWFLVLDNNNPVWVRTIQVPLDIRNEQTLQDNGIVIKNKNLTRYIEVIIRGRKDKIAGITDADFTASVDLSKIKSADQREIAIDGPFYIGKESKEDIQIRDVNPTTLKVELEKIQKNSFKVEVIPTGKLKYSYRIMRCTALPESVSLQGMDSLIKSVASIKAVVDVNNLDRDIVVNKKDCKVYNKNGDEITQLEKELYVDVKIEVAKEVSVVPEVKGKPAKDFTEVGKKVKPEKVLITGTPEVLSKIYELKTEQVDIENSSSTLEASKNILLPDGVKLWDSGVREAAVTVSIEQLAVRDFSLLENDINFVNTEIDNSLNYKVLSGLKVSIKGNKEDIDKLNISDLKPTVDVGKLEEGQYKLPVKLSLPPNAKLVGEYAADVKVEKR